MPVMENVAAAPGPTLNVHSLPAFVPSFDGSFPVQDFIKEIQEATSLGS